MKKEKIGVVIGRFQVPDLTLGHRALLKSVQQRSDRLVVLLGCAAQPDELNPLTFHQRRDMLIDTYLNLYAVHPLIDLPGYDQQWSVQVDLLLGGLFPFDNVRLFGGRDSFLRSYSGTLDTEYVDNWLNPSGTQVREQIRSSIGKNSPEFREGVIWSVLNYGSHKPQSPTDG